MGDTRISVHISRSLLGPLADQDISQFTVVRETFSADTTVRELFESINLDHDETKHTPLLSLLATLPSQFALWDCTLYPPRNITDWPLEKYAEKSGLRSRTLFDAGLFPSGKLLILPLDMDIETALKSSHDKYEDTQYNQIDHADSDSNTQSTKPTLQLVNDTAVDAPRPSQILQAVTTRFQDDDANAEESMQAAKLEQQKNRLAMASKQADRNKKLDDRIRRLDETALSSGSNKRVSEQVQRMLIKSRATGRSDLKQQDRIYFRCLVLDADDDSSSKEEYRYFSPQDTMGRIAASFDMPTDKQAEILIQQLTVDGVSAAGTQYKRLPVLLRVYEAVNRKLLSEFDRIVVRLFDPHKDSPTTDVGEVDEAMTDVEDISEQPHEELDMGSSQRADLVATNPDLATGSLYDQLLDELQSMNASARKKSSAAAVKVKQMQMKSKAKGDAKRVKMDDRFFINLVTAIYDGSHWKLTSEPVFLGKSDCVERLKTDCAVTPTGSAWRHEFLTNAACEKALRRLSDTKSTLEEAERRGMLNCFDQIILLFAPTTA